MDKKQAPNRYVAATLGILFGGIGAHKFYTGETNTALVFLLCSVLLSWTIIVPAMFYIIGLCQGISYLFLTDAAWQSRF